MSPALARLTFAIFSVVTFLPLYLLTRSRFLIGDGDSWLSVARSGGAGKSYGDVGHFLQIPLSHGLWRGFERLGPSIPIEAVYLGLSLAGALASIVFVGLIAGELIGTDAARYVAGILFGTSLVAWMQWNGELYTLALGFATAAVYVSMHRQVILAAVLFALAILAHSEFVLIAPVFLVSTWIAAPPGARASQKVARGVALLVLAAGIGIVALLAGGWALEKWHDGPTLAGWLHRSSDLRAKHFVGPEVFRAAKGLVTAYTVGGHVAGDLVRGHIPEARALFFLCAAVALPIIAATIVLAASAVRRPGVFMLGVAWLLPVHLGFNWYFAPTVEKYHSAGMPGFVLLVTGGLFAAANAMRPSLRVSLVALYVGVCVGLNLFVGVLPLKRYADDSLRGGRAVAELAAQPGHQAVFVSCSEPAVHRSGVEYLSVSDVWSRRPSIPDTERRVTEWVDAQVSRGKVVYVVGRSCPLDEWTADAPQPNLGLDFLDRKFERVATPVRGLLRDSSWPTNIFRWTRVDVYRLVART